MIGLYPICTGSRRFRKGTHGGREEDACRGKSGIAPNMAPTWGIKATGFLVLIALTCCESSRRGPGGPDPGGTGRVALAFRDSALQAAVHESEAGAEMTALSAEDRGIAELGGIEQLTRLEALDLSHNEIIDISPLAGLQQLRFLDLESNRIEDISALASLKRLQVLLLADNGVRDVSAVAGLDSLQSLGLAGNPLSRETAVFLAGLRERGVTVDFEAPPEWSGFTNDDVAPLRETQLLFSSSRRSGSIPGGDLELYSLDLETGEVTDLSAALSMTALSDGSQPDSTKPAPNGAGAGNGVHPSRSPDGLRVTFTSFRDGNAEIYLMRADGSQPINLTQHEAWDGHPCWSPDGRLIAFASDRHGEREQRKGSGFYNTDIFVMKADGTDAEQLTIDPVSAFNPRWSPDGRSIAYVSLRDTLSAIFRIQLPSGDVRRLSTNDWPVWDPSWSPDGTQIAFIEQLRPAESHVWVMAADGGGARQLTVDRSLRRSPTWAPDGTRVAFAGYSSADGGASDIYVISIGGGAEEHIVDHPGEDRDPDWTPF